MQMKFSKDKKGEAVNACKLRGRTGHRVVGANGSIFVMGGRSEGGLWQSEVNRINCQNRRIDSLILDNTLCLQDFALFCFQESLFVWGGCTLEQFSNQLLQFDGSRFTALKQTGEIPKPRANHCYTTFGGKYLIIFGGHNQQQFFNDWYLLNIKTFEWSRLDPSILLNFSNGGRMVWSNGRGILLMNEVFDKQLNVYHPNLFFQLHITDFQQKKLKIIPFALKFDRSIQSLLFTHMVPFNQEYMLIFGGYQMGKLTNTHGICYLVDIQNETAQVIDQDIQGIGFQALFIKQTLYIVGGIEIGGNVNGIYTLKWSEPKKQSRRHVCWMCNTYFDEQWLVHSTQTYQRYRVKEDVDYNYSMKLDNNVLQKMSNYISHEFFALTLVLQTTKELKPTQVFLNLINVQQPYSKEQIGQKNLEYMRLSFVIPQQFILPLIDAIKMQKAFSQHNSSACESLSLLALQLKLAVFRMAKATIMVFKIDQETVHVIYFSSCQLQCTNSNFTTFSNYSYTFNIKSNYCCSPVNRHIIYQNMQHIFKNRQEYQEIETNFAIFRICGNSLESQLLLSQLNNQQTGDSNIASSAKDELKRTVPLIQLSFLPNYKLPPIFIEEIHLKCFNIYEMIQHDLNSKLLKPVQLRKSQPNRKVDIFDNICLCYYPEQYWFKKVLVYHRGRLINCLSLVSEQICGIIELNPAVALDLSRCNLQNLSDRQTFQKTLDSITKLKRNCPG